MSNFSHLNLRAEKPCVSSLCTATSSSSNEVIFTSSEQCFKNSVKVHIAVRFLVNYMGFPELDGDCDAGSSDYELEITSQEHSSQCFV